MWALDCEEGWVPKNWCFWTVVLEKTVESPLDCKEIQPVYSKGDQSWMFFGRTDAKAETLILWPAHAKSWVIGKDSDAGRDWEQEEKGITEDEMVGWHHWHNGHEFGWTLGIGDGQGGQVCCGSWGLKESDMTERLNWTELNVTPGVFIKGKWMDVCYMERGEEDVKSEQREIWRCFAIALKMAGTTRAKLECSSRSWRRQGRTAV